MSSRSLGSAALLLVGLLLTGCGSREDPGTATSDAASVLGPALDRVDAAVVSDEPARITTAVTALQRAVAAAMADGSLSAARAERIDEAARALLATVPTSTPSPTPTSAPSLRPEPEERAPKPAHGPKPGHGHGKAHQHGK